MREELELVLVAILAERGPGLLGIAGAASGGDILFHEALVRRGIPSIVCLGLPPAEFAARSVADAGEDWLRRYDDLLRQRPPEVIDQSNEHPAIRANRWMLSRGLEYGVQNMTLLALSDGKPGGGPGGTEDMIARARSSGAHVVILQSLRQ